MVANAATFDRGLPTFATGRRSTGWWAILLLVLIEIMVFSSLIVSYLYLYSTAPEWPPAGIDPPKLLAPTISAIILFSTAPLAYFSNRAMARNDNRVHMLLSGIGILGLIVFLALKYREFSGLAYDWDTNAYASIVWMIAGFHTAHVITVVLKSITMLVLSWKGFFTAQRRSAVDGNTLYWVFVVAVWAPLFATIYLFPRFI